MASVQDVAAYIIEQSESMSTWKLQKLLYYSQAWHLVWDEEMLFPEPIEAWANGPVVRAVYTHHRGEFTVSKWPWGNAKALSRSEKETVDAILASYGHLTGRQLSYLTHNEEPWIEARGDLGPTDRSSQPINLATMQAFYSALDESDAEPVDELDWGPFDS